MPRIRVEAEARSTEDVEKVKKAILNIFNPSRIYIVEYGPRRIVVAESHSYRSLEKLHSLIRRERILDAARKHMKKGASGTLLVFKVNKQVAYAGHLSFVDDDRESPLGPITVTIETSNPREVIDWLAPRTSQGKPLWEKKRPPDTL